MTITLRAGPLKLRDGHETFTRAAFIRRVAFHTGKRVITTPRLATPFLVTVEAPFTAAVGRAQTEKPDVIVGYERTR